MDAQEYKAERELLYDKAHKLYELSVRGEDGEKETATRMYNDYLIKHGLDRHIVLNVEKFKKTKTSKVFRFDGMEFISFAEFQTWYELNNETMRFRRRFKLIFNAIKKS